MKRIGILGGTTPESTVMYYQRITREYVRRFGDHGYPEILIYSVSFQRYVEWMAAGDWDALAGGAAAGLRALTDAGAELGLVATNTFHIVFDRIASAVPIPLLSILDVVADRLAALGCRRPALLGTKTTMSGSFYPARLAASGIEAIAPEPSEQTKIDRIIFEELSNGRTSAESKAKLMGIAERLVAESGADAIILGCTELPLLVAEGDMRVPVLDTTTLHADAALEAALD
jgi:aspartate racemase